MSLELQLVISIVVANVAAYSVYFALKRKYRKEGKSIKYLLFKVSCLIGLPIALIPFWLSDLTLIDKLILTLLAAGGGIGWYISLAEVRKRIRKKVGLSIDEDWEDVSEEERHKKED